MFIFRNIIAIIFYQVSCMKTRYLNCWIPREANRTDQYLAKWSLRTGHVGSFGLCNGPPSLRDVIIREEA